MKLTNLNDTVVISTSLTRETIEKAKHYAHDSLLIFKDKTPATADNAASPVALNLVAEDIATVSESVIVIE